MNAQERARRRRLAALKRIDADCRRTIAAWRMTALEREVLDVDTSRADSAGRHPSSRPTIYDQDDDR